MYQCLATRAVVVLFQMSHEAAFAKCMKTFNHGGSVHKISFAKKASYEGID
jgi:hypothetical protein